MDQLDLMALLPSPAAMLGMLIFSIIGMWAYYSGKRREQPLRRWTGVALMLYPYVITSTSGVYIAGVLLTALAFSDLG